ncbi:SDR family oxidoreductase [Longispora sp. K20-0274]|uniref:SDR family NAD(P)-dependent oxidoreductase n=1 Tax=Longispora sp. K20-0274 TaxID=3088255 RepID=UPI00399A9C20
MRTVVVTGGATGIGYAVAESFTRAGDHVVITGRREAPLREAADRLGAMAVPFDAADPAAVTGALALLPDRVDVLVNNAGGNTDFDRPDDGDDLAALAANWRANLDANLLSAVLVTTALTPRFADDARIVTIGSIAARLGANSYGAAKAAVEAWTASVATQLGPRGITANVVSPGLIVATEFFRDRMTDEGVAQRVAATRNGRPGTTADVAATVDFLTSPAAGHLTGQVVHVNGGAYLGR